MILFKKKKIEKLENEISLLKKEIETKNEVIQKIIKEKNSTERIMEENKTLLSWILMLIEKNGFKVPEKIPYFKMSRQESIPRFYDPSCYPERLEYERYTIPPIEITRMKN